MSSSSSEIDRANARLRHDEAFHATAETPPFPTLHQVPRRTNSTDAVAGSPGRRDPWASRGDAQAHFMPSRNTGPGQSKLSLRGSRESDQSDSDDMSQSTIYQHSSTSQHSSPLVGRRHGNPAREGNTERQWFDKPIEVDKEWSYVRQLPLLRGDRTLEALLQELSMIEEGFAFIPTAVEARIPSPLAENEPVITEPIFDTNFYDDSRPRTELIHEFHDLARAVRQSEVQEKSRCHAVSWGERVWTRIFDHAVDGLPERSISWHNTTTAAIKRDFKPSQPPYNKPQGPLQVGVSRTIDYALAVIPKQNAAAAIEDILTEYDLAALPATVNPIEYYELIERPVAIAITTRGMTSSGSQTCFQRLVTWTAAWHKRLGRLQQDGMIDSMKQPPISLPLIEIVGHHWWLYCAIEDVDLGQICISKAPDALGSTETLYKAYKLAASLRVLMRWADGPYRLWWDGILGVTTATSPRDDVPDQDQDYVID